MAAGTASQDAGRNRGAAAAFSAVAIVALLYIAFLFQLYNDPGLRELGFTTPADISRYSFVVFALLFGITLLVRMRSSPAPAASTAGAAAVGAGGAVPGSARLPSSGHARPRITADDPASRPGAPPSTSVPQVAAESLSGGWKRYRFPAERTGGLYVDTDIVVDGGPAFSESAEGPRGKMILRVRDEVARVCVRCDLIDHCHSKVAALVTREDMRLNHDCVPGLKRLVTVKLEAVKREKAAAAAPPAAPPAEPPAEAPAETPPATETEAPAPPSEEPDSN